LDNANPESLARAVIEQFCKAPHNPAMFYSAPLHPNGDGQYDRVMLFNNEEGKGDDKGRQMKPELFLKFLAHAGPGADLIDARTNKPMKWGAANLLTEELIAITAADVKQFGLGALGVKPKSGIWPLAEAITRMYETEGFESGRFLTHELYIMHITAHYENKWRLEDSQAKMRAAMAGQRAHALKLGAAPVAA
jgi:hypothetical protein